MLFQTSQEHQQLRAQIREWAEKEIKPIAFSLDKNNEFPKKQIRDFGKMGFMGIPYPKEYGGAGKDILSYAIAVEELSRVDGGTGSVIVGSRFSGSISYLRLRNTGAEREISHSSRQGRKDRSLRTYRA